MRRKLVPLFVALTAALATAAPAPAAEIGLNINGGAAAGTNEQNFTDLSELKAGWARHFLDWDNFEWNDNGFNLYRGMIAREEALNVKTLISVKSAGNTPPDPQAFAARMGELAKALPGLDAVEIWNEADEGMFWAGGPDVQAYVNLLRASYAAIKAANPAITVVFSPTVGNNFGFLQAAYAAGAKDSFDAMAVHTDTACLDQAPGRYYREPDGRIGRFTFLGYREVYRVMQANGDGHKPIWMTEFGWSTDTNTCEFGAGAGQKPAGVPEPDQAKYLLEAMNCVELDPYVQVMMWYNSRDLKNDGEMANMYGLRRFDGSKRPAYEAFQTWSNGGGRSNAPCGDFEGPAAQPLDPQPGFVLAPGSTMTIRAKADAPDLHRIFFRVEGPGAAPLFSGNNNNGISLLGDGSVREREWGGARDLGNGQHKLLIWAVDTNDTPGPVTEVVFSKGAPFAGPSGPGTSSFIQFPKLRLTGKGLKRTFRGGSLPGISSGAVRIEWYLKRGKKWTRYHGKTVVARKAFVIKQKLRRHGKWRVRAVYLGTPGIPITRSCWFEFKSRSKKSKLLCPKNTVRPTKR